MRIITCVVISYIFVLFLLLLTIGVSYNLKAYSITIITANTYETISFDIDFVTIKKAQSFYELKDKTSLNDSLDKIKDKSSKYYNTLLGHFKMDEHNYDEARLYYEKSLKEGVELYQITHLMKSCTNKICINNAYNRYYKKELYDKSSEFDKSQYDVAKSKEEF